MKSPNRSRGRAGAASAATGNLSRPEVAKGRNAVAIYQDMVEHRADAGSYDAVKRFARRFRAADPKVSCRFETPPGQEAQVDYGEGAPTRLPKTGKYRKPRLFVRACGFEVPTEAAGMLLQLRSYQSRWPRLDPTAHPP